MCDSDDPGDGGRSGMDLTGFLFGNIDESGQLVDDGLLDGESKRMLSSLHRLGLGSMLQEVLDEEEVSKEDQEKDYSEKSPSAVDFFDIDDAVEDVKEVESSTTTNGEIQAQAQPQSTDTEKTSDTEKKIDTEVTEPKSEPTLEPEQTEVDTVSDCPQNEVEVKDEAAEWNQSKKYSEQEDTEGRTDDGYEGDMEGDGDLMPPPSTVPSRDSKSEKPKKLETPLAAMLPSKYANVDVRELFPDFRPDKVLLFSRLFGPGKLSSLPQIWRGVKKRRRRKRSGSTSSDTPPTIPENQEVQYASDDEDKFLRPMEENQHLNSDYNNANSGSGDKSQRPTPAHWRFGPAQVWYDMLNVPETGDGFDYGFKLKAPSPERQPEREEKPKEPEEATSEEPKPDSPDSGFPEDSFLMVSQLQWEDDVIWDGSEIKHKVLARLNSKSNAAGWVPTSVSRTAQQFSHPRPQPTTPLQPKPSAAATATATPGSSTNDGEDNTWYSIFPVENEELVYGTWEDEVIWDAENMKQIPKPKILTLDPNDENIILGIPDDVDPSKITRERGPAPKVKIPHPHVKKSKILLGKAGVINVLQEDAPPPPPKSPDRDPFNISNDVYYQPKSQNPRLKVGGGQLIQHSTPVVELRAPFIQTHMGPARLRAFHRPAMRKLSYGPLAAPGPHPVQPLLKHIRKKAKQREAERLASGGGDVFFMRTPEDLSGRDGEVILVEFCEEHPPLISQVGMCTKIKNYYKRTATNDTGPKPLKYGEIAYAHTSPFLGILPPGATQPVVENNMYRAPIYEHTLPQTDFLIIRTRQAYYVREVDALFVAGQECPLYEVPGPNSKRANNFVRDFLQVYIYRLFWKSRDNPRRIKMDDIKRAFPSHSESSIRKRLKLCADFKRTGLDSNWWVIKPEFRLPSEEEIRAMVSPEQCCAYFSMAAAEQRLKDAGYGEKFIFTPQEDDDEEMQLKMDDEVKVAPWNTTRAYIQAMRGKCLLQLTGPADPTGCGEGFSYVRVPNKPTQQPNEEQQPKRTVTGTDADLRRLSLNNAKALLRKFGVPEEEIKKLSRWEVIDVVRTLSTEKAKAGEEGMTKFSRGNRFSIAEHQERYKEECQRIFELQNRVLQSTEVLSTDEAESSASEESDIDEMAKNIENMLANKKTTEQLSMEREEAERAELRKMILGQNEKKPQINQADQQTSNQGRVLRIVRTFRNASGQRYTRVELVRKPAVIEAYTKIRQTKDEAFIRQFATMDETQKEEMKREKRRIQEQLRRIRRNQERERLAGNVTVPASFPGESLSSTIDLISPSPGLIPLGQIKQEPGEHTPSRRRAKLKPDLKLKYGQYRNAIGQNSSLIQGGSKVPRSYACGACGQVGHMRTNKACPLYTGSMGGGPISPPEPDIEPPPEPADEDDLGYVDGTKLTLPSKLIKQSAEDMKRRGSGGRRGEYRAAGRNKRRGTASESCDYLVKRPAERRRTDPLVTLSSLLEDVLNHIRHLPDVQPFLFPVNPKMVADYYRIVSRPMDLQTIRDNLRQKRYQSREDFLADVNQIVENSTLYNGLNSSLTVAAQRMLQRCVDKLAEKEEQLMKLEKQINPLLDDNDQVALSFILENLLTTKLKIMPEAWPFLKPVNKKQVKDYYNVIKRPIDMEAMGKKIQAHKYHSREDFLRDVNLLVENCRAYNGPNSQFTRQAEAILKVTQDALEQFGEHVSQLEANIAKVQQKMLEEAEQSDEGEEPLPPPPPLPPSDEKRGRGRPRKHKPSTSRASADGGPPRKRGRPSRKDQNSLEDDLQYSDSGSSDLEEVETKDAAATMVQLSVKPDGMRGSDQPFDTSEFLIKREVPDEPPQPSDDLVDLDHSTDYTYPPIVKEEPIEPDMSMEPSMMEGRSLEPPPQFKEEPPENWQPDPAIQDDLQVTDSEEEAEDGLWF
ncbi:transcription initiation factor TFIID subunit 1 isoform X3 [Pectinophora gossypiella]|uniref:transcription initiation factor TFIID subunit 1 isoform X3 n=1 Tax=Pectinophora gossypiella TaxID=13191 RepID=UPI00214F2BF6|nr:transcription initiation factor TFIID subunit 1 isoform X3 [Pectinophora gossypiella]